MSRARPPLQLNLRGAFDHATDLNDHLVIERRSRVFKTETLSGGGGGQKITWVAVGRWGEEGRRVKG